jgi:hypothetical protein
LAIEVGDLMGLSDLKLATIKAKTVVHKDNNGALTLAKMEPGQSMPYQISLVQRTNETKID